LAHVILWEFRPRNGREEAFEAAYGPAGRDYLGFELLKDRSDPARYLGVDWSYETLSP
jgi:hypothetical protein